jgi:ATP-dependent Clp protease adaptor protein ClpS
VEGSVAEPLVETVRKQKLRDNATPKHQPRFRVILWNDEDHTYHYVVWMLKELFGYPEEKGFQIAETVDTRGQAVVIVTTKEHAELKRDQIHAFGKDPGIENCKGSMWATIEPVEEG